MSGSPDPKPVRRKGNRPRRVIDPDALRAALFLHPTCAACGAPAANAHHVLERSLGGDDATGCIVGLCGTGTMRCHGAFHGSPYVVTVSPAAGSTTRFEPFTERRDREWVARRIGETITRERPDVIAYLVEKLGEERGRDFLERVYHVTQSERTEQL